MACSANATDSSGLAGNRRLASAIRTVAIFVVPILAYCGPKRWKPRTLVRGAASLEPAKITIRIIVGFSRGEKPTVTATLELVSLKTAQHEQRPSLSARSLRCYDLLSAARAAYGPRKGFNPPCRFYIQPS